MTDENDQSTEAKVFVPGEQTKTAICKGCGNPYNYFDTMSSYCSSNCLFGRIKTSRQMGGV